MKLIRLKKWIFYFNIYLLLTLGSCVTPKNQILFQGLNDSTMSINPRQQEPFLQRGDQLLITVYALDQESAAFFNAPMTIGGIQGRNGLQTAMTGIGRLETQANSGNGVMVGYLIDENGEITFPKLGNLKVIGYTQSELRDSMQSWLSFFMKEPIVNVRLLNFRVTIINPDGAATVIIANNKTNILQFLGMVQGLKWLDKRNDIKIIRQIKDKPYIINLNLTDYSIFNSEGYYLQPNDIIYIEPQRRRFFETSIQAINSITTSLISSISLLLLIYNTTNK